MGQVNYPETMKHFRREIGELSRYLTKKRDSGQFGAIEIADFIVLFENITAYANKREPIRGDEFALAVAQAFMAGLAVLYSEIGKAIGVDNEALLATFIDRSFRGILDAVLEDEDNAQIWN